MTEPIDFTDEEPQRGFTGYFIPVEVLNDPDLRNTDKFLLAEIVALSKNAECACWASNEHLAQIVGMTAGGVANALTRLRRLGYVENLHFDGRRRWIRASMTVIKQGSLHYSNDEGRHHQMMNIDNKRRKTDKKESLKPLAGQCEEIWLAYPRKAKKPPGLRAIAAAIKRHGFEHVLERTQAFAKVRPDKSDTFTPHPATWFNAEQYNDDPVTWKPKPKVVQDEYGRRRQVTAGETEKERKFRERQAEAERNLRRKGLI